MPRCRPTDMDLISSRPKVHRISNCALLRFRLLCVTCRLVNDIVRIFLRHNFVRRPFSPSRLPITRQELTMLKGKTTTFSIGVLLPTKIEEGDNARKARAGRLQSYGLYFYRNGGDPSLFSFSFKSFDS